MKLKEQFIAILLILWSQNVVADAVSFYVKSDSSSVFSLLIYTISVAALTFLVCAEKAEDKKGAKTLFSDLISLGLLLFFCWVCMSFFLVDPSYSLLISAFGIVGFAIGKASSVIASMQGKMSNKPVLAVFLMVVAFFAQLNLVETRGNSYGSGHASVIIGFVKLEPLRPGFTYLNGSFSAQFENKAKVKIILVDSDMRETLTNQTCALSTEIAGYSVEPGQNFTLKSSDCPKKADWEPYDILLSIRYNSTVDGITTTHTETGHIKGSANI